MSSFEDITFGPDGMKTIKIPHLAFAFFYLESFVAIVLTGLFLTDRVTVALHNSTLKPVASPVFRLTQSVRTKIYD